MTVDSEITVRLARCDKTEGTNKRSSYWDIAFELECEDNPKQYIPITIYGYEIVRQTDEIAMQLAAARTIPHQISKMFCNQIKTTGDYFDELEKNLTSKASIDPDEDELIIEAVIAEDV